MLVVTCKVSAAESRKPLRLISRYGDYNWLPVHVCFIVVIDEEDGKNMESSSRIESPNQRRTTYPLALSSHD